VGPTDSIHASNGEADGNGTKHMKNYNIWHRAQICIFYGIEHMSYIFLWHIGSFLKKKKSHYRIHVGAADSGLRLIHALLQLTVDYSIQCTQSARKFTVLSRQNTRFHKPQVTK
jgi:hypothetical protein